MKSESQRWYDEKGTPKGVDKGGKRLWERHEDEAVLARELNGSRVPDIRLAEAFKRTVHAIHERRSGLRRGYKQAHGCRVWC